MTDLVCGEVHSVPKRVAGRRMKEAQDSISLVEVTEYYQDDLNAHYQTYHTIHTWRAQTVYKIASDLHY